MQEARRFLEEVVGNKWSVLLVPDKDADGLSGKRHSPDLQLIAYLSWQSPIQNLDSSRTSEGIDLSTCLEQRYKRSFGRGARADGSI